jgi:hypothetical protein
MLNQLVFTYKASEHNTYNLMKTYNKNPKPAPTPKPSEEVFNGGMDILGGIIKTIIGK